MLDAASLYETLPETITIMDPSSYHYAYEGTAGDFIDESSIDGLTASFVSGDQVAFSVMKTTTDGAITSLGEVVIQLFNNEVPNSASHFEQLAFTGYYDGLTIHRIIPGFMFQGGSSDGYGYEGSDLGPIADEFSDDLAHSSRGVVAYANSGSNTNDAQFYVTFDATPWLDGYTDQSGNYHRYTVFGYVVDGYDVIDELENATVTTNPRTGEASFPVDSYTIENVRYVETPTRGALRIVADDDASGVTTISFASQNSDDSYLYNATVVYVGQEGFEAYVEDALNDVNFDVDAGTNLSFSLPTEFGGYEITYTIDPVVDPEGFTIVADSEIDGLYGIQTESYAGQFTTIDFVASLGNGLTTTVSKQLYIRPSAPTVSLVGTSETKVADLESSVKLVSSNLADSALTLVVECSALDLGATTDTPLIIRIDGSEYTFTSSHTYDEEDHIATYVLNAQLRDADKLSDGMHSIAVSQFVPVYRDGSFQPYYSDETFVDILVDTVPLAFPESAKTININVGDAGAVQLNTNKADADGVERSDVVFTLANPDAGPRFISLSESGAFSWNDVIAADGGVYYVDVNASDAFGDVATMKLTLNVGSAPVFAEDYVFDATTGETLVAIVSASVPGDSSAFVRYELGAKHPSGVSLNETTGELVWVVPEDYFANSAIDYRETTIELKAIAQTQSADGEFVDGESTEQSFALIIHNALFDESKAVVPVWDDVADQTVSAGELLTFTATATAIFTPDPESGVPQEDIEFDVLYDLVGDYPNGAVIGSVSGDFSWAVPSDYFKGRNVRSEDVTITIAATAVLADAFDDADYSGVSTKSVKITVNNPDYVDNAPVFDDLILIDADGEPTIAASTGKDYFAVITAVDPDGLADRIVYELVGDYDDAVFTFDADESVASWTFPADYLDPDVTAQVFTFVIKATEQFLQEDGTYRNGLSTQKTFETLVANANYDDETGVVPVFEKIDAQKVKAGETFTLVVKATATKEVQSITIGEDGAPTAISTVQTYDVEYSLTDDAPVGMTIDSATGELVWDVPEDYFDDADVASETLTISVQAAAIISREGDGNVNYGESAATSFELTVTNPNYSRTDYDSWNEWFGDWLDAAQERYEGHQANLQTYLNAYLDAIAERKIELAAAKASYVAGETSLTELLQKSAEIASNYENAVNDAKIAMIQADEKTDVDYFAKVDALTDAFDVLAEKENNERKVNALQEIAKVKAENYASYASAKEAGASRFRLCSRTTGAKIATDLTSVLTLWRDGYSYGTVYDELYSDLSFVATTLNDADEATSDNE